MFTSIVQAPKLTKAIPIVLFALMAGTVRNARGAQPDCAQSGPMIKNLMALTYRAPCAQTAAAKEFTRKDARQLAATAESRADHLQLAAYYSAQADRLDSEAVGYEAAAAALRHGPAVKNLTAPTAPARYDYFAKGLRQEAKSNRSLAASHAQAAEQTTGAQLQ